MKIILSKLFFQSIMLLIFPVMLLIGGFTLAETDVYICKGPQSKRYHLTKSCQGLKNCSTEINKVSLSEAKKMERTLCGFED